MTTATEERVYSEQQHAIREWFCTGKLPDGDTSQHLVGRARAGCAKTTTALWAIDVAPDPDILLCAFAKVNADDFNAKLTNPRAKAQTLHSAGYACVRRYREHGVHLGRGSERAKAITDAVTHGRLQIGRT